MAGRSYIDWWRWIGTLPLTTAEWAVLTVIAAHADWATGEDSYPSIETVADTTGLGPRTVTRALRSLACAEPRCSEPRCRHRGLLVIQQPASRHRPTTYGLRLDEQAVQQRLPEVGIASGGVLSGQQIRARLDRRSTRRGARGA